MSNEVQESYINQVGQVQFEQHSKEDSSSESSSEVSDHASDEAQTISEKAKSWLTRYEQFLYGVVVGGAAVVCSLSVRSLIRSK